MLTKCIDIKHSLKQISGLDFTLELRVYTGLNFFQSKFQYKSIVIQKMT